MKHRKHQKAPRPKTAFERETERRRREMIRNLSASTIHTNKIPEKRLKRLVAEGVRPVTVPGPHGTRVVVKGYSNRNFFRDMARELHRPRGAAA